ncbi:spore germination protein [Paenibacillus sp. GCM10012307]|uniref:Spore germination protein n=1 Tax=Paenibacillus roseus TaxID=2798579 RepID=A0A934J296_9BACL|nr:spore germination protein [Paenibacillus roseus]MBJ6363467.1 spore germination protein [Paenibacillus roseus]
MRGWSTDGSDGQPKFKHPAILQQSLLEREEDLTAAEQDSGQVEDERLASDQEQTSGQEQNGDLQGAEHELGEVNPGDKGAGDLKHALGPNSQTKQPIPKKLEEFRALLEKEVGLGESFDVIAREMTFGKRRTSLFFINGFVKDTVLTEILKRLTYLHPDEVTPHALHSFFELYVPAVQVVQESDFHLVVDAVLAGSSALFIEDEGAALLIDAKAFPARNPEEPTLERVVRGSRDGFVETMLVNVTLVRRRLRDPGLRYEIMKIGRRTKTDVCIAYINDIADPELLDSIKSKLEEVELDGLPLADKQLEEATVKRGWNPYPLVRYSERPDVVAAQLLEGNIAVFVDTSPSVMLLPTTFFDLVQHAEENRQTPFIGTFLRWVRFLGIFASLFLLPIWFLYVLEPGLKPPALDFIGPSDLGRLPLVLQFLVAEIGVDLMRLASVHTPTPLATAMSLIAAILIGDIAVKTGLFINEVILYMAVAAIGMFATPSYELGLANRIVRLLLIISVAVLHLPGLVMMSTLVFIILVMERSFNRPYMWPLIPFDARGIWNIMLRTPVLYNRTRPSFLRPQQLNKIPSKK